jgi:hypothetical protein
MRVFARGVKHPLNVAIDRPQRSNTRELDWAAVFGSLRK